jgi:hypothetical protein
MGGNKDACRHTLFDLSFSHKKPFRYFYTFGPGEPGKVSADALAFRVPLMGRREEMQSSPLARDG